MKTSLIRKLTSRKFWAAVAAFVTMAMTAAGAAPGSAEKVAALIMAGAAVVAYIVGEGLADSSHAGDEEGRLSHDEPDNCQLHI